MPTLNLDIEEFQKASLDIQLATARKALAYLYTQSLYRTAKDLLGYKDITEYTHLGMIRALESPKKRKLLVMPRGTFKSSIGVVAYAIWLLLRDPDLRILIDSEKYENSKNFIREIKLKLEEPLITQLFGTFRTDHNWSEGSITIAQRKKIFKESSVTASGISANKTGQHFDVVIHDDMNSDKNSDTPEKCQKIIDHYRLNTSILEPEGIIVVIGTRYSQNDLIQFILDQEVNDKKALLV